MTPAARKYLWSLFRDALLHGYSQIFFSLDKTFGIVLLIVSFTDPYVALSGLSAGLLANFAAYALGYDHKGIREGMYSFNSIMMGMMMGVYYDVNLQFVLLLALLSMLVLFLSIGLQSRFGAKGLPVMSIPFLFGVWTLLLVGRQFTGLDLSERGIYTVNELWSYGGQFLVNLHAAVEGLPVPELMAVYLRSLGAIFFQNTLFAGFIILLGLVVFSRIAFVLSVIGFFSGYFFFGFMSGSFMQLNYTFIGFNFILSSIALGGFFIIPSFGSHVLVVLTAPVIAILISALSQVMGTFGLPIYSLPYNIIVLLTLYTLRVRAVPKGWLTLITEQTYSPEKNLYRFQNRMARYARDTWFHIYLPFYGEWTVSQGYAGNQTHKGEWQHALDFSISDGSGSSYKSPGSKLEDFYCYNRPIVAPQDGWVVALQDGVADNRPGEMDLEKNWGNAIVIKHGEGIFSKVSHIREGTYKVALGDHVKKGQVLANIGNSGRSPEPHIHFQLQATPFIGSRTMAYPLAYYAVKENGKPSFRSFATPKEGEVVSNIAINPVLKKAFALQPGMRFQVFGEKTQEQWEVYTDAYNHSYIWCAKTESTAYFVNNGTLFYFTDFIGDRDSILFRFHLAAQRILLSSEDGLKVNDRLSVDTVFGGPKKAALDAVAPFAQVVRADFAEFCDSADRDITPKWAILRSNITVQAFGRVQRSMDFRIDIGPEGVSGFDMEVGKTKYRYTCALQ